MADLRPERDKLKSFPRPLSTSSNSIGSKRRKAGKPSPVSISIVVNRTCSSVGEKGTRAREELVVYFNGPSAVSIEKAKQWFGEDNVICIHQAAE
ncbi:MAG: hypothetical protein ABJI96_05900 [Paracoccaceae bacterium]